MQVDIASTIPRWVMHASLIALFGKPFVETINLQAFLSQFNLFDTLFEVRINFNLRLTYQILVVCCVFWWVLTVSSYEMICFQHHMRNRPATHS